jgi:phage shock protein A
MYLLIAIIVIAVLFLFYPQLRSLFSGFIRLFIRNVAETPEGARAVYEEAINEAQNDYNKAHDYYQKVAGEHKIAKDNLSSLQKKSVELDSKCRILVQNGNDEEATLVASQLQSVKDRIETQTNLVAQYGGMEADAKDMATKFEINLRKLKDEMETVVDNLEQNIQVKKMYDMCDELKRNNPNKQLIGMVKDGAVKREKMAVGAKVVHENSVETKLEKADTAVGNIAAKNYIESLKSQYGKKA